MNNTRHALRAGSPLRLKFVRRGIPRCLSTARLLKLWATRADPRSSREQRGHDTRDRIL
jgi:hypothetical protein